MAIMSIEEVKRQAEDARRQYRLGIITRDQAAERIAPYAEAFNLKSKELAAKYDCRAKAFSLASYLR
jgi:uncharacterized protein YegL